MFFVWVKNFAGRPMPQKWAERSLAVDTKAEVRRIVGERIPIPDEHLGKPLDELAEIYPAPAAQEGTCCNGR